MLLSRQEDTSKHVQPLAKKNWPRRRLHPKVQSWITMIVLLKKFRTEMWNSLRNGFLSCIGQYLALLIRFTNLLKPFFRHEAPATDRSAFIWRWESSPANSIQQSGKQASTYGTKQAGKQKTRKTLVRFLGTFNASPLRKNNLEKNQLPQPHYRRQCSGVCPQDEFGFERVQMCACPIGFRKCCSPPSNFKSHMCLEPELDLARVIIGGALPREVLPEQHFHACRARRACL